MNSNSISFFAEPYVGFGLLGSASISNANLSPSVQGDSYFGVGFGARLGFEFERIFFAGMDFSFFPSVGYNSGFTQASVTPNPELSKIGLIVGIALQSIPFRFWLGYNFMDLIGNLNSPTVSSLFGAANLVTLEGYSFKAGVGYRLLPYLSLNAEYFLVSYGTFQTGGVNTPFPSGTSGSGGFLLLSISGPIGFSFN